MGIISEEVERQKWETKGDILEPKSAQTVKKVEEFLKNYEERYEEKPKEGKALRYNSGKTKWSLMHYASMVPMIEMLIYGANKYSPNNWMKGLDLTEILESMQRHLAALMDGETYDEESKVHHIGAIMCNAMFYAFHWAKQFGPKWKKDEL